MTTIADRVREARLAAGLSQTALAGSAFSPSYISLIEAGHREPTDSALAVLASRLGTTLEFLRHGEDGPNEARTRLEIDYARLDMTQGDAAAALRRLQALDLDVVTPALRVLALTEKARAHEAVGELEESVAILEPLVADARARHHHVEAATLATQLVASYLEAGDLHRSVEVGERVLADLEEADLLGTDEQLRLASTVLWSYVERGDLLYSTHRAAELIELAESQGSPRGRGSVYWNAALVAEQRRDYELAQRYTERALALLAEGEPDRDLPRLRLNYAWLLLRSEPAQPQDALDQIERAAPDLAVLGSEIELARLDVERSRAHLLLGDLAAAESYVKAALERLGDPPRIETAIAQLSYGDVLYARNDIDGAAQAYRWAADMLGMMQASRQSAAAWRDLGDRFLRQGDAPAAAQAFDRALREAGFRPSVPLSSWETWSLT
ncbi:helix-turn-helix domain-containing protein [Cellulomonas fimi]|uniref:Helix-turn-helix domain protein n=1 Tax=Cellulomonas fimi (strain ATCC 484 / DSM 20113 / JCM 1341 / CCUG 24087 / LMG 16345 / NBRC 15513 / NCIMB 8980 / NCTC 7547 / NRS-133) TaxID=590998 RepID=F4H3E7_CELFA|nr:helix-turn-helix transcriptional regulator [Cellulomonas fimi]AEE46492.1 helix-turn-helix domain protein [Cellulomonas fimi ATCC 484]NNH08246.1 helix-turn-helix domain-containing protein [Cellulomonas fimi]VEH33206.1 Predicted ATPase [Cellulomonas fimi]